MDVSQHSIAAQGSSRGTTSGSNALQCYPCYPLKAAEASARPCGKARKAHLLAPLATLYYSAQCMHALLLYGIR